MQNNHTPEHQNEVERMVKSTMNAFCLESKVTEQHALEIEQHLRQILTPLIEDRDAKAREVVNEVKNWVRTRDHYDGTGSYIIKEELLEKLEALSHNIDLSTKK